MPANANASIQDTLISNQIDLIKLEGSVRGQVLQVLKELEGDLVKRLAAIDPTAPSLTSYQQLRLQKLLAEVQTLTGGAYAKARRLTNSTLLQLADLESGLAAGSIDIALGTSVGLPKLNRQTLQALVNDGLIQGAPSREWWAKQSASLNDAFKREMRLGTLAGESVGQLTNRVKGLIDGIGTRQAEALARTSVQSVANLARLQTYQENADLIKAIKWISTLDSRTTDICKGLDGLMWDPVSFEPIGHSTSFPGPTAHWNCRSTQTPITRSFEELATINTPKAKGLAKRLDAQGAGVRSALDGTVPASITYEQWLLLKENAQPGYALTSGALTPGKYALWKQGKLNFKELIDQSANPITIAQLKAQLAGLIPSTALPAAALQAQQAVVGASGSFASKTSQAAAQAKTAKEAMAARVKQAQETAAVNAKKEAQDQLKLYQVKDQAPSTYHYNALKDLTKKKGGAFVDEQRKLDPIGLLDELNFQAAKKKLSVDLAHYKQSVIKGKKPSAAAQAAFETLPDEAAKDVLDAIKIKQAEEAAVAAAEKASAQKTAEIAAANQAAAVEIQTIIANPAGQTKLAKALQDGLSDPTIKQLSPARQLAAAKQKAAAVQAQAEKSAVLSGYKKKLVSGEKPTPKQSQVVAGLSKEELETLNAQITKLNDDLEGYIFSTAQGAVPTAAQEKVFKFLTPKAKKEIPTAIEGALADLELIGAAPSKAASVLDELAGGAVKKAKKETAAVKKQAKLVADPDSTLDMAGWKKTRAKPGGSVPGAVYADDTGQEWIVKYVQADDIANNEVLTAKLYKLAGVEAPDVRLIKLDARSGRPGGIGVASKWIDDLTQVKTGAQVAKLPGTYEGFAADAWLADWDVVGLNFDNIVKLPSGRAIRIDVGSGLRYRAQGGAKGANFGSSVDEIESLRTVKKNRQAAEVFKNIPKAKLEAGVAQIIRITDDEIDDLVTAFGGADKRIRAELSKTLKARRDDLAKRYPHLARQAKPPPPRAAGKPVGPDEYKQIENARATGFSIRSDVDEIEDQMILLHQEVLGKTKQTVATLKVRAAAKARIEASIRKTGAEVEGLDTADVDRKFLTALKGLAVRTKKGEVLDPKDFVRAEEAAAAYKQMLDELDGLIDKGVYAAKVLDDVEANYTPWINAIQEAVAKGKGKATFNQPPGVFEAIKLPKPKPPVVKEAGIQWSRGDAQFGTAEFDRGFLVKKRTGNSQGSELRPWTTTLDDGTEIKFWGDDAPAAMRGRVQVEVSGHSAQAANRAVTSLDDTFKIKTRTPTALDEEELYLIQLAFARKTEFATFRKLMAATKTQTERVAKAKEWLSKKIGRDITKSPNYQPTGYRSTFETGKVTRYRADLLDDSGWKDFEDRYRLHHNLYRGGGNIDAYIASIDRILSSGGRLTPTTDKLRLGIKVGRESGMSAISDLKSGGADYFFTRIVTTGERNNRIGLSWKARQAARTDSISYTGDKYGRTDTEAFILQNRQSSVAELRGAHGGSNETILKGGASVFDDFDAFIVPRGGKAKFIKFLREQHGFTTWPDGRKLEDIVREVGR